MAFRYVVLEYHLSILNTMSSSVNPEKRLTAGFSELAAQRRSVYAYLDQPVPEQALERALQAAMLAPNHHRTRPWRFFVIPRDARDGLVQAYEAAAVRVGRDVARAVQRAKDAPVNIVVACAPAQDHPRAVAAEEEFATAAAAQNLMLSLAESGLGTLLTTGELAQSPELAALVGLDEPGAHLVGLINVGYPNPERQLAARAPFDMDKLVRWIGRD